MRPKSSVIFLYIVVLSVVLYSGCQETNSPPISPTETNDTTPQPKLVFESMVLDLGTIKPSQEVTGQYKFSNQGDAVLEISGVEGCCGFSITVENGKMVYEPGESGIINVQYTGIATIGRISRTPKVFSNDPIRPTFILSVTTLIEQVVIWEPETIKISLAEKNGGNPQLKIFCSDNQPFSITGFTSTSGCITADIDPLEKATEYILDLQVDLEKVEQNPEGSIRIIMDHPHGTLATVYYNTVPRFSLNPSVLNVPNAVPNEPVERTLLVYNNYEKDKDFEIESILSTNNTLEVKSISSIVSGYKIGVEVTPPPKGQEDTFTDVYTIKIKDGPELVVNCKGLYKANIANNEP